VTVVLKIGAGNPAHETATYIICKTKQPAFRYHQDPSLLVVGIIKDGEEEGDGYP
jgi:hypothetical protein